MASSQTFVVKGSEGPGHSAVYREPRIGEGALQLTADPTCLTLYDLFERAVRKAPNAPYMGHRPKDPRTGALADHYVWQTYSEVQQRVYKIGSGLLYLWENHTPRVYATGTNQIPLGLYSANRPEWTMVEFAGFTQRMYSVPLYDTLGPNVVEYIVNFSEVHILACSVDRIPTLLRIADRLPTLKVIVCLDSLDEATGVVAMPGVVVDSNRVLKDWANKQGIHLVDLATVEKLGIEHPQIHHPPQPDDLCSISYTSGSTGTSKGVMLTHTNLNSAAWAGAGNTVAKVDGRDPTPGEWTMISYLPLAHIYEHTLENVMLLFNASIGFYSGSLDRLMEDIALLRPSFFPTVPRVLTRLYTSVAAATIEAPGLRGAISRRAVAAKLANLRAGHPPTHVLWDSLLFNKVRAALGGQVRTIFSGGAPLSPHVKQFIAVAFCCDVHEGYGQTETSAMGTLTCVANTIDGDVGIPTLVTELRLEDVPEMDYYSSDKEGPRGEICIRGPDVFIGYYKDPEKTREVLDEDGWLHSGDIGQILPNGTLKIIDRKKNIFKLAQGEYIAPEKIENVYVENKLIQQAFVYGDSLQPYLVCVAVPDGEIFVPWAKALLGTAEDKSDLTIESLVKHPKVVQALLQELTQTGAQRNLHGFEQIKAIHLETVPFTIENGLLTPSMKPKRHFLRKHYQTVLDDLYAIVEGPVGKK
ncbi:medium-chain fatty acid-CoA ligase faa2 [Dispira simplex]|nr:medium-chain fatty acid-CoA ligase faa2 [Dispira simplex]